MLDWRSFWIGILVATVIVLWSFIFYNIGYERGQKHPSLARPSATPVQFTDEAIETIDLFLLDQFLLNQRAWPHTPLPSLPQLDQFLVNPPTRPRASWPSL